MSGKIKFGIVATLLLVGAFLVWRARSVPGRPGGGRRAARTARTGQGTDRALSAPAAGGSAPAAAEVKDGSKEHGTIRGVVTAQPPQ